MHPANRDNKFTGSVYVLIGPGTFSSASDFASVIEDYDLGTLVGEETGGQRQCFGDCFGARLPLDKIDACPEDVFTRILWAAMKGPDVPYPTWAVTQVEDDDD